MGKDHFSAVEVSSLVLLRHRYTFRIRKSMAQGSYRSIASVENCEKSCS